MKLGDMKYTLMNGEERTNNLTEEELKDQVFDIVRSNVDVAFHWVDDTILKLVFREALECNGNSHTFHYAAYGNHGSCPLCRKSSECADCGSTGHSTGSDTCPGSNVQDKLEYPNQP